MLPKAVAGRAEMSSCCQQSADGGAFMVENRSGREAGVAEAPPHYHGHRERLRERFREGGSGAVTDYELLELVLFRALPRRDVKPLAKSLIARFGSFGEVIAAPWARLAEVDGLGEAAITEFKVVEAAALRLARGEVKRRHLKRYEDAGRSEVLFDGKMAICACKTGVMYVTSMKKHDGATGVLSLPAARSG